MKPETEKRSAAMKYGTEKRSAAMKYETEKCSAAMKYGTEKHSAAMKPGSEKRSVIGLIKQSLATIRMRVTLWYAFFMMLMLMVSLSIISELSAKSMRTNQQENLIEIVSDAINEFSSPGEFEYFANGVYLLLYDAQENYLEGIIPEGFSVLQPLKNDYVEVVELNNLTYFRYDKQAQIRGAVYWLRGLMPQTNPDPVWGFIVGVVSVFMPGLMIVSCIIGYLITKRAFGPVRRIQETAQNIADSDELSLRIGLPAGTDEIARLGRTVDNMLDKLQRSFEQEKQFTADVSHELRTPLTVILTESEYALQHAESLEEAKESLSVVSRQADRMAELINQLLFLARADQSSLKLARSEFMVLPVINELVEDYRVIAAQAGLTVAVAANVAAGLRLGADRALFIRSLSNLIQNAVNYSNPGGHIEIGVAVSAGYLMIAVKDQGLGIAPEHIPRIWDRFYQVEESRSKTAGNGMGLGLSMVKTIVGKHGGDVRVSSEVGKGSVFAVFYPLGAAEII